MKQIRLGGSELSVPVIALGCMRIASLGDREAEELAQTSLECGMHFFDHADIYGGGKSEEVFAKAIHMSASVREKVILQSKCGIRPGVAFDFSKKHILESVEGSLRRLRTDYLDVLLLHRPDTLMEPEEVGEAFSELAAAGKVRHFGVSNCNPFQIELLQSAVGQKLVADQLQLSLAFTGMIDAGLNVNMKNPPSYMHDGGILEYCRLKGITIQPWSPFQYGFFEGVFIGSEKYPELNRALTGLAAEKGVTPEAIAIAWLLRHPAKMQPILGTTNAARVKAISKAADIELTREEWYGLYMAAGNVLP